MFSEYTTYVKFYTRSSSFFLKKLNILYIFNYILNNLKMFVILTNKKKSSHVSLMIFFKIALVKTFEKHFRKLLSFLIDHKKKILIYIQYPSQGEYLSTL